MDRQDSARRLLLVHAHPDDESIGTGATIARYAAEGVQVTLVTCTRGELGEVIPPELAYLTTDGDRLGEYRMTELAAACAVLGIGDQRFLGGPGRWRDSGMMGSPDNDSPDCFWQADLATAAVELAGVIREIRPQVLVTYDKNGFYGHPDHIQAHRVAAAAIPLAAGLVQAGTQAGAQAGPGQAGPGQAGPGRAGPGQAGSVHAGSVHAGPGQAGSAHAGPGQAGSVQAGPWQVAKFYATAMPESVALARGLPPHWVPDSRVTTEIDGTAHLTAKAAAMRAHATQIAVDGDRFALANGRWQALLGEEFYTLLAGVSGAAPGTREHDLFAGLDGR